MLQSWGLRIHFILFFKILCVTCLRNSSLTFVIDYTGSMQDDIDQVKVAAADIMDIVLKEKASEIEDVVLVTFNDPMVDVRKKSSKKAEILQALNEITAYNIHNPDCPEYSLTGIVLALEESRPGSYLFVFTDASAKDYYQLNVVKRLCEKKQSQVVFVLTGDCNNPFNRKYKVYHEIAMACNGQVFRVRSNEVKDVLETIKETVKGQKSVLTSQVVPGTTFWFPVPFTVDDKTEYVVISTSGQNVDLTIMDKPRHGSEMTTTRIMWKYSGKVVKFSPPKPGTYYAWVKGNSDISIVVYARTDFTFEHGFSTFVPKSLRDTSKQPIADLKHHLSISVTDPNHTVDIKTAEILDMNEKLLQSLPLQKANGDFYITQQFVSPSSMFKIQVIGINKNTGFPIKRISKTAIEPQIPPKPDSKAPEVTIAEGTKINVGYDGDITLTCKVSAYPEPKITWTIADGTVLSTKSSVVELPYEYISYLKLTHVKNPATYYCRASNEEARNKFTKIDVNPQSPFKVVPSLAGTESARYGKEKILRCGISSSYPIAIKWNTPLKPSQYSLSTDQTILTIKSMSIEAQGKYSCEATLTSDPQKKQVLETNVVISDLAPPTLNSSPSLVTVSVGKKMQIPCKISGGVPPPSIIWQFKKNTENEYRDLPESSENLIVASASLANNGQYRCIVKNDKGQIEKVTKAIVQKRPTVVIEDGSKKSVAYGSTNTLTCKIEAYPLPKIMWKDGRGNKLASQDNISNNEITSHLQIQNIRASNTYSCFAENVVGKAESKIDISVTSAIVVNSYPPATTTSKYGATTVIPCNIKSMFPMKIKWFHQSSSNVLSEIHTSDKYMITKDGKNLRIYFTDLDRIGKYSCKASLESDGSQKVELTTDVQINDLSPPVIHNSASKYIVNTGKKTTIPCKIDSGTPPPTVSWQFMKKGDNKFRDLHVSSQILTIDSTSLSDAGKYRCIATNAQAQSEKNNELIVKKAPEATIDEGASVTVPYGSPYEFKCRVVAYPPPTIVWKDSKGHELTHSQETINDNEIVSKLKVLNAKTADSYSCYAENDLGKSVKSVHLTVLPAIAFPTNLPGTKTVKYGSPTNIICDARSLFPMKIKWFYQKENSSSDKSEIHTSDKYILSPDDRTLHITFTDLEEVGKYTCEASLASDEKEKKSFTTKVEISDLSAPNIITTSNTVTIMNGQKMDIACEAKGTPVPVVTWQFKPVNSNDYDLIPDQGKQLIKPKIGYEHAGSYKCTATNAVGTQSRAIDVIVHGKPKITNVESVIFGVTGDKVLKIPCQVIGVPEPTITWKREGIAVTTDAKITFDKNSLFIKNPSPKDSSNFTCKAENKYGNDVKHFESEISDFIEIDKENSKYIYLKPGESTVITCDLPDSGPKSVRWYVNADKNAVQGSSYSLQNANFSNDGNYTCRVNTDQGSASVNYIVDVGYKPSFTRPQATPIFNWNGNMKDNLDCNVQAKPKEKVEWFYNGKALNNKGTELPISGWGYYTCNVSNAHGSVQQAFNVTSDGCIIDRTVDKVQNIPLLISNTEKDWPIFTAENEFYKLKTNEKLTLECSTIDQPNNMFKTHPKAKEITAECYKEDQFTVNGKMYKFQDLQCVDYVKPTPVDTNKPCMTNGKIVEIGFKLSKGLLGVYDVCYSESDHRTLYSKTTMSDINMGNIVGPAFKLNSKSEASDVGIVKCQYNQRRFVNPVDVAFGPPQIATLTDKYNSVPVFEPCDKSSRASWSNLEDVFQSAMYVMNKFTVWTGASKFNDKGVPRYLWKVIKYEETTEAIVYVNTPDADSKDILCSRYSDDGLSEPLNDKYTYNCAIDEFLKIFEIPASDFGITD